VSDLRRLIREIHRRSLWQVLSIYLVSGWVAYEVIESLTDGLELPSWLPAVAIVILIAGLPIVLATAFVQEGPPGGTARGAGHAGDAFGGAGADAGVAASDTGPGAAGAGAGAVPAGARLLTWRNALIGGLAATLLVAAAVAGWILFAGPRDADQAVAAGAERSDDALDPARVAVLYFDDLSQDGSLGYLADGFTEALIHELSQVERLDVISRNGVKPYRDAEVAPGSVVRALSVGTLVEGSLERTGRRLRATVQLIDGATSAHLMSATLEAEGDDLLALRDQIVREAAILLRRRLGEEIELRERERERDIENAEAWTLVQRAGGLISDAEELEEEGATDATARMAAEADSLLALAEQAAPRWTEPIVGRGRLALWRFVLSGGRDAALADSALARGERALGLAPDDADALHLRGVERLVRLRFLTTPANVATLAEQAERWLRAALAADPDRAESWAALSSLLQGRGRFAEAYQAAERALAADPFLDEADNILFSLCANALERGDVHAIDRHCPEAHRRFPAQPRMAYLRLWTLDVLNHVEGRAADIDSAWAVVETLLASAPETERSDWRSDGQLIVSAMLAHAGLVDSARAVLRRARSGGELAVESRYAEAYALLRLGERDSAIASLRILVDSMPANRVYLTRDRAWEELWDDPAFQALVSEP